MKWTPFDLSDGGRVDYARSIQHTDHTGLIEQGETHEQH